MTLYNVKLTPEGLAKGPPHIDGFLYDEWTQKRAVYSRGEAIKKAAVFGGKIEAVEEPCKGLRTVFTDKALQVTVKQGKNGRFCVIYGEQAKTELTYEQAARELGECLFHSLACEGVLTYEGE